MSVCCLSSFLLRLSSTLQGRTTPFGIGALRSSLLKNPSVQVLRHRRWSSPRTIASLRAPSILYLCLLERPSKICSNNSNIMHAANDVLFLVLMIRCSSPLFSSLCRRLHSNLQLSNAVIRDVLFARPITAREYFACSCH